MNINSLQDKMKQLHNTVQQSKQEQKDLLPKEIKSDYLVGNWELIGPELVFNLGTHVNTCITLSLKQLKELQSYLNAMEL